MNIVVTGASSGIGFHTALEFLKDSSHRVYVISRSVEKLELLLQSSKDRSFLGELIIFAGDLRIESDRSAFVSVIKQKVNAIDILINNAGVLVNKPFEELTSVDWEEVYSTNVFSVVGMIRDLLPLLNSAEEKSVGVRSHIVNIGSMGGLERTSKFKGLSAYSSSKAAITILTECLAEEFKDRMIAVNSLALGSVQTEMFSSAFPGSKAAATVTSIATYIVHFSMNGSAYHNGKTLAVSNSTP